MTLRRYLPSAKLVSIVGALALSVGLVFAADRFTHRAPPANIAVDSTVSSPVDAGWEAALYASESQNASSTVVAPDPGLVGNLLQAAQGPNLTESIGKSILISLTNAKSQGLGDDIPTQNQILGAATAQMAAQGAASSYTLADLTIVPVSKTSLHAYGDAVMQIIAAHPDASFNGTFLALGNAIDHNDPAQLELLPPIKAGYAALAADLLAMPVPQTLAPFHVLILTDFAHIVASYDDMKTILADPLRGAVGFKSYQSSLDEMSRVFTNIAQTLNKDGILFTKDEPGSAWSIFLAPTGTPGPTQ